MDGGISVQTFALNFEIDSLTVDEKRLRSKGVNVLAIDGKLKILVNGRTFFEEPELALIEFGVNLATWRRKNKDAPQDFHHFTMEHDEREGAILSFLQNEEGKWTLFSIWQQFEYEKALSLETLTDGVDLFLGSLGQYLTSNFGIQLSDI